jgi:hypothetical protein
VAAAWLPITEPAGAPAWAAGLARPRKQAKSASRHVARRTSGTKVQEVNAFMAM